MIQFKGIVEHKAYNYFAWVPFELSSKFKQKGYIPVRGTINNYPFSGYLAPRKPNRHVLYLHNEIRRETGIKEFDEIEALLEYDPVSRDIPIPEDVEWIMKENDTIWTSFMQLSNSQRNECLKYILEAKRPETRLKRIEYIIQRLIRKNSGKNTR